MITLDKLKELHEIFEHSFVDSFRYRALVNNKDKNHWERLIACIENLIRSYHLKVYEDFKRTYDEFQQEIQLVKENKTSLITSILFTNKRSPYEQNLLIWIAELDPKTITSGNEYKDREAILPFITELTQQYENYSRRKSQFIEELLQRKDQIALLKKEPEKIPALPSPLLDCSEDILLNILRFINKDKDLLALEHVSYYLNNIVEKSNVWINAITEYNTQHPNRLIHQPMHGDNAKSIYKERYLDALAEQKYQQIMAKEDINPPIFSMHLSRSH